MYKDPFNRSEKHAINSHKNPENLGSSLWPADFEEGTNGTKWHFNEKTRGEIENNRHSADRNINSNKNNFKDQSK